jgi:hypothetical protein
MSALDMHRFVAANSFERGGDTAPSPGQNPVRRTPVAEVACRRLFTAHDRRALDGQGKIGSSSCKKRTGGKVRTGAAAYLISC